MESELHITFLRKRAETRSTFSLHVLAYKAITKKIFRKFCGNNREHAGHDEYFAFAALI